MPTTNTIKNRSDEFAGKVAFITGAGSGIGRATALAVADRGAAVSIADVSAEASRDVADEIVHAGGQALGLSCDVTSSTDVQTALQQTVEAFGRLDFAFNNAGIEQPPTPLADITEDQWQRVLDIDLRGVFLHLYQNQLNVPHVPSCDGQHVIIYRAEPASESARRLEELRSRSTRGRG